MVVEDPGKSGKDLGHSSPAMTQSIYQHARPERTAEAVERVGSAIFEA